jgi:DNA-binding HxlR family transcriptional regulator
MTAPTLYTERQMLGKDYEAQDCSIARALEVVGERWTLLVVRDAFYGVRRFNDFQAHLDIPKAVLSDRLDGLVENGILERQPDPDHAGRQLYELTSAGRDLWPVLNALLAWGGRHRYPNSRVFKHADCGTRLDDAGYCPSCGLTPAPEDILMEPRRRAVRDDPVAVALRAPRRLLEPIET